MRVVNGSSLHLPTMGENSWHELLFNFKQRRITYTIVLVIDKGDEYQVFTEGERVYTLIRNKANYRCVLTTYIPGSIATPLNPRGVFELNGAVAIEEQLGKQIFELSLQRLAKRMLRLGSRA